MFIHSPDNRRARVHGSRFVAVIREEEDGLSFISSVPDEYEEGEPMPVAYTFVPHTPRESYVVVQQISAACEHAANPTHDSDNCLDVTVHPW